MEPGSSGTIVAGVLAGLVVLAALVLSLTHYRLGRHEFEVLVGKFVIRRVFLKDIDDVTVGGRFPSEFWPSPGLFGGGCLTIRRKRGWLRHLTVTTRKPEQLRVNLFYALGWEP